MRTIPLKLSELNALVSNMHRHHKPVQGHKFSIGVINDGVLVGGCSVGRPVARACNADTTLEITRLVTDGTRNACSFLLGKVCQIAKLMGYEKVQTYILETENGASLKSAGFQYSHTTRGGQWKHTDGKERRTDQPICKKQMWVKNLLKTQEEEK